MTLRSDDVSLQDELGQVIANSFYGMEAGYLPTEPHEMPTPSSGDLQLAFDVLASPVIRRIQAEALREAAKSGQAKMFAPAVYVGQKRLKLSIGLREWLNDRADHIERTE